MRMAKTLYDRKQMSKSSTGTGISRTILVPASIWDGYPSSVQGVSEADMERETGNEG